MFGLDKYFTLPTSTMKSDPAWFGFLLTIKGDLFTRAELVKFLESKQIATRNLFGGNLTKQPAFMGVGRIADILPKSDIVMGKTFWIGVHPGITEEMMDYVVDMFVEFINEKTN